MIIDGKLVISKKPKAKLIQELKDKGFKPISANDKKDGEDEPFIEEESEEEEKELGSNVYDYLLGVSRCDFECQSTKLTLHNRCLFGL